MKKLLLALIMAGALAFGQGVVSPRMLKQDGATSGQCLQWDGSKWAPAACTTSAGSGTEYQYNNSGSLAAGLQWHCSNDIVGFGGCTASFPGLKRNGTRLEVRLADDSGLAELRAKNVFAGAANLLGFASSTALYAPSNGSLRLTNAAGTDFGLLQFGGTTSDYPALKRSSTTLQVRLADDSADALLKASVFNASSGFQVAGAATSGNFLRGNGTYFVSSAIQAGDVPDLSGTYQVVSEKGAANGYASLNTSSLVVENPANATATPTASKIPIAEADGNLANGWIGLDQDYTWTGAHDFSAATLEVPNSTSLPGTCSVGEVYVDSDANAGQRLYLCESADTWVLQTQSVYNVKAFGAVGDGTTDDTAAINAAEAAAPAGACVYFPSGTYKVTSTVTVTRQQPCWYGDGPHQSIISGNFAAGDIVVFGNGTDDIVQGKIANLKVMSSVLKSSGAAWRFRNAGRFYLWNVVAQGQGADNYLWDGFWFDQVSLVYLSSFESKAQNDGLRVNGEAGAGGMKADLFVSNGFLLTCTNGVHVGGAFGGAHFYSLDVSQNTVGMLIDQALTAEGNREITAETVYFDSNVNAAVRLSSTMTSGHIKLIGTWLSSSSAGVGLDLTSAASTVTVVISGGSIINNSGDGVYINSASPRVLIDGTEVTYNGGYGINNAAGAILRIGDIRFEGNTSGDVNGNQEDLDAKAVKVTSATPSVKLYETDAGSDEKYWRLYSNGGAFYIQTANDAYTAFANAMYFGRSGNSATNMTVATGPSNGSAVKIDANGLKIYDMGTKPTCSSTTRGYIWREEGGAGVADKLEVCAKNSSDTYAWYPLASIP